MKETLVAYLLLVIGMPAMHLAADAIPALSGPGSGWLATAIPLANLAVFCAAVIALPLPRRIIHVCVGVAATPILFVLWGLLLLGPDSFNGIQ